VAGFFRPALVDRSRWTGIGWPEAIGLNWWRGSDGRAPRYPVRRPGRPSAGRSGLVGRTPSNPGAVRAQFRGGSGRAIPTEPSDCGWNM